MEKYKSSIHVCFKLDISAKQVHSELKIMHKDVLTVNNWFHLFKKG